MADLNFNIDDIFAFEKYLTDKFNAAKSQLASFKSNPVPMPTGPGSIERGISMIKARGDSVHTATAEAESAALMYHILQSSKNDSDKKKYQPDLHQS